MNYWLMTYETPLTVLLTVIGFLLVVFAQIKINTTYSKYRKVQNSAGLTGQDVARKILDSNGLSQISVYEISGNLSDHYNPSKKLINLSKDIYNGTSIASLAVAAHECGHAIQDKEDKVCPSSCCKFCILFRILWITYFYYRRINWIY